MIYQKADKFVQRTVELMELMAKLQEQINHTYLSNPKPRNYMDAYIRSYGFKCEDAAELYILDMRSEIYKPIIVFGSDSRQSVLKWGGGNKIDLTYVREPIYDTVNNSESTEFQLRLIDTDEVLFQKYVHTKLAEKLPNIKYIYLGTLDVLRLIPAIKALKDIIDESASRPVQNKYLIE